MSALRLQGVSVELGGRTVVDELTFAVGAGEWVALIGPNGAGKTTTLRAISGVTPCRGLIELGGQDARRLSRRERAQTVAVVPQIPITPPDLKVKDYVLMGRTPHLSYFGSESAADREAADRAVRRLDLDEFLERPMGSLSGGERQRAVMARALAQEARVVLLDEPTSALDLARQHEVLELIDCLRREEGLAVVAAMHDLSSVALYAEQVLLLSAGRLVASGPPLAVLEEAMLSRHFGVAVQVIHQDGGVVVAPLRTRAFR